ncbi:hypothetical protein NGRA_2853 [Nosema granulosis]|uniref:Uncharacterized protein n=1 Tax=Nosema granulosis TaxID=83296 RepID=A0A9P6GVV5_9MICR|nr:hypothetical protein NGRA_2853 [Nosema granulosis]
MLMSAQVMTLSEIKKTLIRFEQVQQFYQLTGEDNRLQQTQNSTKSMQSQTFCSFHKSKGHNTSECIAYSNWKKRNNNFIPKISLTSKMFWQFTQTTVPN